MYEQLILQSRVPGSKLVATAAHVQVHIAVFVCIKKLSRNNFVCRIFSKGRLRFILKLTVGSLQKKFGGLALCSSYENVFLSVFVDVGLNHARTLARQIIKQ